MRYKRSSISVFFTMLEPVALISIVFVARFLATGTLDWNDAVFHATGILPFFLFMHISQRIRGVDTNIPVPRASWFDRACAVVMAEVTGKIIVGIIIFVVLYYIGAKTAVPYDLWDCYKPCTELVMIGVGVGLFNASVASFFPSWLYIYAIGMRLIMLTSGLVIRPDMIPPVGRYMTDWNPIFHGVTWFRYYWFANFPGSMIDENFLLFSAAGSLVIGSAMRTVWKERK